MEHGQVSIVVGGTTLSGNLIVPANAAGLVVFAHGSGSSRMSPRNMMVAGILRKSGLGTLLFDLLTPEEEQTDAITAELRFNIPFLAQRLLAVTQWAREHEGHANLNIGYFGASTGAAAALAAAAEAPGQIAAIVSRGGRPDLAEEVLSRVRTPTLLIVGAHDEPVIEINTAAHARLQGPKQVTIIPGAGHLFEEPGALDQVARLATDWFLQHLAQRRSSADRTSSEQRAPRGP